MAPHPLDRVADRAAAREAITDLREDARVTAVPAAVNPTLPQDQDLGRGRGQDRDRGQPPPRHRIALENATRGRVVRLVIVSVEAVTVRVVAGVGAGVDQISDQGKSNDKGRREVKKEDRFSFYKGSGNGGGGASVAVAASTVGAAEIIITERIKMIM